MMSLLPGISVTSIKDVDIYTRLQDVIVHLRALLKSDLTKPSLKW